MSKAIIIRGPLGIGKSTIARLVAKKLNGKCYSIDDILSENNLDKMTENEECISEKNFIHANEIVLPKIKKHLENNKYVIIDGNFYHKKALEHLINNLQDYSPVIYTLKAPVEICIERDSKRNPPHGKWATIAVHNLVSRFDYGTIIENNDSKYQKVVNKIISENE